MKWHELTSDDLAAAREKAQRVALIPVGSLERHGPHLPLGCDTLIATAVAERVAAAEPVVVLPTLPYTYVDQCVFQPGAVHVKGHVLVEHLLCLCDELYGNGFDKIVLLHAHGGNVPMSHGLTHRALEERRPWAVYSIPPLAGAGAVIEEVRQGRRWGHACEIETSCALALFPELCHMDRVAGLVVEATGQLDVGVAETAISFIADWPAMTVGEPGRATAENGERILAAWVEGVVSSLRKIKADTVVHAHLERLRREGR